MTRDHYDPVYLHSLREAAMAVMLFLAALVWSIGVYYAMGYVKPPATPPPGSASERNLTLADDPRFAPTEVSTTFGMPSWVFYGVLVPWLAVDLVAIWYCFFYIADDELGPVDDDSDVVDATPA